ncbi:Zn-dependent hydrolase of the beta-lactamase fold-like protein [Haloterrigena turkmenica DSM 5511]|uniref:Zn-dependent hydrolase of the beta-lactamase fold-like protein n=1 Tax=Haloterrigena turkmenica (strain ATCC 51198 / DSM 5511 / JCM 9101 / NCIMB 13204 / VKM B-1734 / 4k) TaxID=543526 RepID=D2RVM3_HALTV|nr:MBL fold metallo-hydrolase [Haloterrigena turkmenica]ADB59387.1 Zn-dependent hydrolase of the beta-lactamase fold-like protein [Haloterrigena turkmenica DSM 5511]
MTVRHDNVTVSWLGYATVRIESADGTVVYVDPGRYGTLTGEWDRDVPHPPGRAYDERDGDLVLVTHDHHYDSDGVRRVASEDATVIAYEAVDAESIRAGGRDVEDLEALPYDVQRVEYGEEATVEGVDLEVLPAFNHPDGPNAPDGDPIHPEGFGCGYRFAVGGTSVCWTGDSDVLDDHTDLEVSLFLPPIGKNFTMNRTEAAELAAAIDPDLVCPIHYNTFPDLDADSRAFAADVAAAGVPVVLDEE